MKILLKYFWFTIEYQFSDRFGLVFCYEKHCYFMASVLSFFFLMLHYCFQFNFCEGFLNMGCNGGMTGLHGFNYIYHLYFVGLHIYMQKLRISKTPLKTMFNERYILCSHMTRFVIHTLLPVDSVAQLVERRSSNPKVVGSNLT